MGPLTAWTRDTPGFAGSKLYETRIRKNARLENLTFLLACALLSFASSVLGQANLKPMPLRAAGEYEVKAAFLLNFTRFVEWPVPPTQPETTPFSICVLGDDPFGDSLNRIVADEKVAGRPLVVKRIRKLPDACEILFIPNSQPGQAALITQVGQEVLTVGEAADFLRDGGMIRFLIDDHRVRFDINRQVVDRSSLKMSSRLLMVARVVK